MDCSAEAAARSLLSRTSTFVSKSVPVPGGGAVDLSTLDPAALINSVAHETRFAIASAAEFNARWRAALRERFEAQGVGNELDAWLATGLSNGRPLKLEVMAIKLGVGTEGRKPRRVPMPTLIEDMTPCTAEECARFRSATGMVGWLSSTGRCELRQYHSRVSQYMAAPVRGALDAEGRFGGVGRHYR